MLTSFSCGILVVPICLLDVGSYYFFFVSTVVINFITPIVKSWTVCNWFFSREWTFGWSLDSSFNNIACAWSQAAGPPLFSAMKHCCKLVKIPEKLPRVWLTFWLNALLISVAKATLNYITYSWILTINTVKSRAVDRSTIQFLSIFGMLLTEMCY